LCIRGESSRDCEYDIYNGTVKGMGDIRSNG
jgi:hypothetical protein